MCGEENPQGCCCQKPEHLKERPEACTPEQIQECHGETQEHPCTAVGEEK